MTNEVFELEDARHRNCKGVLDLLDRGTVALAAFLSVERENDPGGPGVRSAYDFHRLANCCACCDDIVDDEYSPFERCAHDVAALTVIFGFLAIESPRIITAMGIGERRCGDGDERDAFVGGSKQHVELDVRIDDGLGVEAPEPCQRLSRIEEPRVEKIWAHSPGFEFEFAEAQHAELQAQGDEGLWIRHVNAERVM